MNKLLINISRLGLFGWLLFETLNWVGVLHFSLDFTWRGLIGTVLFAWIVLEIVSWRIRKSTGQTLPWFAYVFTLCSLSMDALGDMNHWYSHFPWYDQIAHFIGGGVTALVAFFVFWRLVQAGKIVLGKRLAGFIAVVTAMSLGVLYELEEYLEDVFSGVVGRRLGDGPDTANDLMLNTIGAIVVVAIAVLLTRRVSHSVETRSNPKP